MKTYHLNWKRQFIIIKHTSHPTNTEVLESEKEANEERETILEEITEPTDEELKELEQEDEKAKLEMSMKRRASSRSPHTMNAGTLTK